MLRLKEGDAVRIVDRIPTTADLRTGLYYNHYRNLSGRVFKLYGSGEKQEAAIEVAIESLPEDIAIRHQELTDRMRASLTGDARRAAGPGGENEFRLRYIVLVAVVDLVRHTIPTGRHTSNGHTH
jgi:hypothetical protein